MGDGGRGGGGGEGGGICWGGPVRYSLDGMADLSETSVKTRMVGRKGHSMRPIYCAQVARLMEGLSPPCPPPSLPTAH